MDQDEISRKMRRTANVMRLASLGVVGVIAATGIFVLITAGLRSVQRFAEQHPGVIADPASVPAIAIIASTLISLSELAVAAAAFAALARLFGIFETGDVFDPEAGQQLRRTGQWFIATAVWTLLANSLQVLVLSAANPPGQRHLAIGLSSEQIFPLLLAGILYQLGHILSLAAALRAENRSFV